MENTKFLVFVYGTLMKGRSNHKLISTSNFLAEGILHNYGLYRVTVSYPGIRYLQHSKVKGEIYEVNQNTLKELDILEDEGKMYKRIKVTIKAGNIIYDNVFAYEFIQTINEASQTLVKFEDQPWKPLENL